MLAHHRLEVIELRLEHRLEAWARVEPVKEIHDPVHPRLDVGGALGAQVAEQQVHPGFNQHPHHSIPGGEGLVAALALPPNEPEERTARGRA